MENDPVATARGSDTDCSMNSLTSQINEFVDARFNYARQSLNLFRTIVRGTERVANLLIAQLRQNISQPLCLRHSDVAYQVLILAFVIEANQAMIDSGDEL